MTIFSLQTANLFGWIAMVLGVIMSINDSKKQLPKFKNLNYIFFAFMGLFYAFTLFALAQNFTSHIFKIVNCIIYIIILIACNKISTKKNLNSSFWTLVGFSINPILAIIIVFFIKNKKYN